MSDEFDNNPKATDTGTQSEYSAESSSGVEDFTDRPVSKRNKSGDPEEL